MCDHERWSPWTRQASRKRGMFLNGEPSLPQTEAAQPQRASEGPRPAPAMHTLGASFWRAGRRSRRAWRNAMLGVVILALVAASVGGALIAFANGGARGHGDAGARHGGGPGGDPAAFTTSSPGRATPSATSVPTRPPTPTTPPSPTVTPAPSPPCLALAPLTLTYTASLASGNDPGAQTVNLYGCSNQVITWSAAATTVDGASWLNFKGSPDTQNISFTMNPDETMQYGVDAQVIENNLQPGSYSGTLTFTSGDGSISYTISVSLTVGT